MSKPLVLATALFALIAMPISMSQAMAADVSTGMSTADLRWACEQRLVARVRLTSIGLQAPDAPCAEGATSACEVVVAQGLVMDSLPTIGGESALVVTQSGLGRTSPNRVNFRFKTRDAVPPAEPPLSLVGVTGLLTLPEHPGWGAADPAKWTLGTFVPDGTARIEDLDAQCKPFRHWSGLRSASMPEQLPGDFAARHEGPEALGKRIAALIGPTPPDVAAIERSFGARMVSPSAPTARSVFTRTLARLDTHWVRIGHNLYLDPAGPPSLTLTIEFSGPQKAGRQEPWWASDPTDREASRCVTSSMVVDQVADEWGFSRMTLPYRGRFMRGYPQYDVQFEFSPPYWVAGRDTVRAPQSHCLKAIYIFFAARSKGS